MKNAILPMLDRLGPKRIVIASSAPPICNPDCYGIDMSTLGELVAFKALVNLEGMCGYQEIQTDPPYAGQFVTLTTDEVGSYGVTPEDVESRGLFLSSLVIGDLTQLSNFRATQAPDEYLKANGVPGIYGVDTRALPIHLREYNSLVPLHKRKKFAIISTEVAEVASIMDVPTTLTKKRIKHNGYQEGCCEGRQGCCEEGAGEEGAGEEVLREGVLQEGCGEGPRQEGCGEGPRQEGCGEGPCQEGSG